MYLALHQVFRFNIKNSTTKPELILGKAFQPGKSANMFCKPTSVASLENGDFFVADGKYINTCSFCIFFIVHFSCSRLLQQPHSKIQLFGRKNFGSIRNTSF